MNKTDLTKQEEAQINLHHYLKNNVNATNGFWMIAMRLRYIHSVEQVDSAHDVEQVDNADENADENYDENPMYSVKESIFSFDSFYWVVQDQHSKYELPKMTQKLKDIEQVNNERTEIWLNILMTNYFKFAERVHSPNQVYGKS